MHTQIPKKKTLGNGYLIKEIKKGYEEAKPLITFGFDPKGQFRLVWILSNTAKIMSSPHKNNATRNFRIYSCLNIYLIGGPDSV